MGSGQTRHSVNSGSFYPIDQGELLQTVEIALNSYVVPEDLTGRQIKALLVPFLPYSADDLLMASAYSTLVNSEIDEIFLFSDPTLHKLDYVAFSDHLEWETPLGKIKTTHRLNRIVSSDDSKKDILKVDNSKHQGEISLECQLPYIQSVVGEHARIIPFLTGQISPRTVTKHLAGFIDEEDILICVSNISADIPVDYAKEADQMVLKAIQNLDMNYIENHATTLTAPNAVSLLCNMARQKEWKPKLLDYAMVDITGHMGVTNIGAAAIAFVE